MHSGMLTASSPGEGCGSVFVCELPVLRLPKNAALLPSDDIEKGVSGMESTSGSLPSNSNVANFLEFYDKKLQANKDSENSGFTTKSVAEFIERARLSSGSQGFSSPPSPSTAGNMVVSDKQSTLAGMSSAAAAVANMGIKIPNSNSSGQQKATNWKSAGPPATDKDSRIPSKVNNNSSTSIKLTATRQSESPHHHKSALALSNALATPKSKVRASAGKSREDAKRVLVVDDAAPSRKMLLRWLQNAGYVCYSAVDGQDCLDVVDRLMQEHMLSLGATEAEALAAVARTSATAIATSAPHAGALQYQPLDFIFMDYEMPRVNGPEASLALRKRGITAPIIGVTGNVLVADKEFFLKQGATTVLHKPLDLGQLTRELNKYIF
jgi:CheY-like chemotaxis protein